MNRRIMVVLVAAAALAGGCGEPQAAVPRPRAPLLSMPTPSGYASPAVVPPAPSLACQPERSLRPLDPLPAPGQPPAGSTMAAIRDRGRLIVGTGGNAYLLSYRDSYDGRVKGFEADIAMEIAFAIFGDREPSRIQWRALNAVERIPAVRGVDDDGNKVETVDLVLAAMTMSCDRWEKVDFSANYYTGGQRVLVRGDSGVRTIDDLGGKKVCSSATSTNIQPVADRPSHPIAVTAANTSDCLLMLEQGQIDAVSTGDLILAGLAAQDPATEIVGPPFHQDPTGVAISKNSADLVRFVNGVLERLMSDGTWKRFQQPLADKIGLAEPPVPQYRD